MLSGLGIGTISVTRRPRVAVLITGEELLPPGSEPQGCRIPDMNSPMLSALIERDGGEVHINGPLPDDRVHLRSAIVESLAAFDMILISGGSSTGPEDHAPSLVAELGELLIHGVALRPASPTGVGIALGKPIVLLPGNPVSCLCAYDLFAGPMIRKLGGRPHPLDWPYASVRVPLTRKLVSALGRTDYTRIRLIDGGDSAGAEPIAASGAAILSSTVRADGFTIVPENLEGYPEGTQITVWLY